MNHRRSDVRAAVFARQRSQGHLRAVTVTVGIAGVVTAGVVAAILPGSTHASASSQAAARPAPASTGSPASTAGTVAPAASSAGTAAKAPRHRHHRARKAKAATPATSAPAAPVPVPAATVAPPQTTSGGS